MEDEARFRAWAAKNQTLGRVIVGRFDTKERRYGGGRNGESESTGERLQKLRDPVPVFLGPLYTGQRLTDA